MLMFIYFFIAVGVSFLCSILEAVLLSIDKAHVEVTKNKNKSLGSLMQKQQDGIDYSIGSILTLNTFAHTLGAAGVGAEAVKLFGQEYMFYISAILTILILVFSEIIPKTIGAYYWKALSGFSTRVISFLVFITYPLLFVMSKITSFITTNENKNKITKEEITAATNIALKDGIIKNKDSNIINNLLNLENIKVKDIHTPRSVVESFSEDEVIQSLESKDEKLDFVKLMQHSRIPVYSTNIDSITGVLFSKEYFLEYIEDNLQDKSKIIKPVFSVYENIPISKLIDLFISRKEQLFIVVDRYDQTEGIVTLEDAIETLLGSEIVDEQDKFTDMRELAKSRMKHLRKGAKL
ncbi:MAG: CNNM domain-containing protein [Campylobacterota bacterium]